MKKKIFILLVLIGHYVQASQKRKFCDDAEQPQPKKIKIAPEQVTQSLIDELSRHPTKAYWQTRKQKIMQAFETHHVDLNTIIYRDRSIPLNALEEAVDYGDHEFVHWLLERGMNAQTKNALGEPVICRARNINIARDLVAHGASVDSVNNHGEPLSLHAVMEKYDPELVQLFGAFGRAAIMSVDSGATPLARLIIRASSYRSKEIDQLCKKGRFLIESGATITDPMYEGKNFDELIAGEIAALQARKSSSYQPAMQEKDIKKLEALSQEVHKAAQEKRQKQEALSTEVGQAAPLLPMDIRTLIALYTI